MNPPLLSKEMSEAQRRYFSGPEIIVGTAMNMVFEGDGFRLALRSLIGPARYARLRTSLRRKAAS